MQLREMSYDELINVDGGDVWQSIGDFFSGLAAGFMDWFLAI